MEASEPVLRIATPADEAALDSLIRASAAALFPRFYAAREAASAVAKASRRSFLRALPLESTRTLAESLGGTSTTDSPEAANLTAR